jgi:hypothetical protein
MHYLGQVDQLLLEFGEAIAPPLTSHRHQMCASKVVRVDQPQSFDQLDLNSESFHDNQNVLPHMSFGFDHYFDSLLCCHHFHF